MTEYEIWMLGISLIAGLSTFGAAIAAWKSAAATNRALNEQIKRDEHALKPLMVLKEKAINFQVNSNRYSPHIFNWDTKSYDLAEKQSKVYLELVNASSGYAKNVKIEREIINLDTMFREIVNPFPFRYFYFEHSYDESGRISGDVILNGEFNAGHGQVYSFSTVFGARNHLEEKIVLIGKYNEEKPYYVEIPKFFVSYFNLFSIGIVKPPYEELPKIKYKISCENEEGKPYYFEHIIGFEYFHIESENSNEEYKVEAILRPMETHYG